jgi:two-component system, chemotaxis family, chemotaxis protein CheY
MLALVVDDSRAMRMILRRIMSEQGYEVVEAADGQEALDVLEGLSDSARPDVALIDWNMPNVDGLELVVRIRKNPEWRSITLMMVTTESEYDQIVRALAAGAHEYVIKPFTPEAIVEKLQLLGLVAA